MSYSKWHAYLINSVYAKYVYQLRYIGEHHGCRRCFDKLDKRQVINKHWFNLGNIINYAF